VIDFASPKVSAMSAILMILVFVVAMFALNVIEFGRPD